MKRPSAPLLRLLAVALLACAAVAPSPARCEQTDTKGCQDHALFTRMPTYWIHHCQVLEFDSHVFPTGDKRTETVEGRTTKISYYPQATAATKPSPLQIVRNYEAAVQRLGGKSFGAVNGRETFQIKKDGREVWVDLTTEFTGKYGLTVVERGAMKQDIEANAAALADGLHATGHIAVYGIHFDTGKTDLKPESESTLAEIAKLLAAEPALKLHVVGHTDNVGTFDANMKLSQGRADAVVAALVGRHGVAAARLRAGGVGPLAPVASNDAETGRAQNRRVELVKQ